MKLVKEYLKMHLKALLEYRSSFIMTSISQIFSIFVELYTVVALFDKFALLDMYNKNELLLGFSIIWFGMSMAEMFARGFDHFADLIVNGNFDLLLIRPRNIYLQVFGSDICFEKSSRVLISFLILIYSLITVVKSFTILKLLLIINMIIGSIIVFVSIFIFGASFCFISIQGLEFINIFTNGSRQIGQYPMGIYKKFVKKIFTFLIPLTLVNYYPILYLTDKITNIFYVFLPLATLILLVLCVLSFNKGIHKYCSTGS